MNLNDVFKKASLFGLLTFLVICFFLLSVPSFSLADEITLQWNWDRPADLGISGYRVYYSVDKPGGPYDGTGLDQGDSGEIDKTVAELPDPPEITLTGLDTQNHIYYFVITAYSEGGLESDYSNEVSTFALAGLSPAKGSVDGNTSVTITGGGFLEGLTVTFGGEPATIQSVSSRQIICLTPAHNTGWVNVRVTNPNDEWREWVAAFEYVELGVSPSQGGVAVGASLDLEVTGATGDIEWTVNDGSIIALGGFSGAHNHRVVLTGITQGKTTITVRDTESNVTIVSGEFEVVSPVQVTTADGKLALLKTGTLEFSAAGGKGSQNSDYTWSLNPASEGSISADGLFAPSGVTTPATFTVTATDKTYTDVSGQSRTITIVDPLTLSGPTEIESAGGVSIYTGTGGSVPGTYVWTSSNAAAGTINSATGAFTPATVTSGTRTTTIRATDPSFSHIYTSMSVKVFSRISITSLPTNYDPNNLETAPLLKDTGLTYDVTVSGGLGDYTWSVVNSFGVEVAGATTGSNTYTIVADDLFSHSGAGVYRVMVTRANATPAGLKIRVPLRLTPFFGFHLDSGSATFTVSGHPAPYALKWVVTDEQGQEIIDPGFVVFDDVTYSSPGTNNFQFQAINHLQRFRVQAQSTDQTLAQSGLDTIMSHVHTLTPVVDFLVRVNNADTGEAIQNATVTLTSNNTKTARTNALGRATITGMRNTGVTYTFEVRAVNYAPMTFATTDLSQTSRVSLIPINPGNLGTISGTVSLDGVAGGAGGILVSFYNQDSPVVLADAATGAYTLNFDTMVEGAGPYTIMARKSGYVTDFDDNQGIISAHNGDTSAVIDLLPKTRITITADEGSPTLTYTLSAGPIPFNGTPGEIMVFTGTGFSGTEVTDYLTYAGGTYQLSVDAPPNGDSASIYVEADTVSRSADSGYFARATHTVIGKGASISLQSVDLPDPQTGDYLISTGSVTVILPPGGVNTHDAVTLSLAEYPELSANPDALLVFQIKLTYADSGEPVPNSLINRIYVIIQFDPPLAEQWKFESGQMLIYQAEDLEALTYGYVTTVPLNQIIPSYFPTAELMFWLDHLSVFSIDSPQSQGGGTSEAGEGGGGGGCFINTIRLGS